MKRTIVRSQYLLLLIITAIAMPMSAQQPAPPLPTETPPTQAESSTETDYHISTRMFQIRGAITGQMSLAEDIGWRDAQGQPTSVSNGIQAFTLADLTVAGARYRFDSDSEFVFEWDSPHSNAGRGAADAENSIGRVAPESHRDPSVPRNVDSIFAPNILVRAGQDAAVFIKPSSSFQYLQRLDNGLFELHEADSLTGAELHTTVRPNVNGTLQIDPFKIILTTVKSREKIEGVDLNIGKPIVSQDTLIQSMRIRPDRYYGFLWNSGSNGQIHIILKVTPIERTP